MSLTNRLLKYGVHGGLSYAALHMLSKGASSVDVFGTTVPLWAAGVGLGVASSITNDMIHTYILPMISVNQKLQYFESTATSLAAGAGSLTLYAYLAQKGLLQTPGVGKLMLYGAGTEVAAQYIYERLAVMFGVDQGDLLL